MFAIIAAVIFGPALILDWSNADMSDAFTPQTLLMAGLLCIALRPADVGAGRRWGRRR
ncbi:hypothetical protein [Kribbella pittospori]|uniref:hypothetical protein n=1 Tax=Kribbella pittospori TaxID=722689 RepID=UPI0013F3A947|nr:hypothetical protein [Kribbella pittospori]